MTSPIGRRPFDLSLAWTLTACGLLILTGLLIVALSGDSQTVAGVGGAVFSLGVVTLISEFYLKSSYTRDLIDLVDLSNHVREVGFLAARPERQTRWDDVFSGARSIRIYLPQPTSWADREWPDVLQQARARDVSVEIYVPDPEGPNVAGHASMLGHDSGRLAENLRDVTSRLGTEWRAALDAGSLKASSSLTVYAVTDVMPYGLVAVDGEHFLLAYDASTRSFTAGPLAVCFSRQDLDYPFDWFKRQWDNIVARQYDKVFESQPSAPSLSESRRPLGEIS